MGYGFFTKVSVLCILLGSTAETCSCRSRLIGRRISSKKIAPVLSFSGWMVANLVKNSDTRLGVRMVRLLWARRSPTSTLFIMFSTRCAWYFPVLYTHFALAGPGRKPAPAIRAGWVSVGGWVSVCGRGGEGGCTQVQGWWRLASVFGKKNRCM